MSTQENQSEVAKFLQKWDEEMEAIRRGMNGFALTGRHEFITRRMQAFGDEKMIELMALAAKQKAQNTDASSNTPK